MLLAGLRGRIRDEEGFTLVELMFAMLVATVITGLLVYMSTSLYRTNRFGSQDSDALGDLRVASDRMVRELRQAQTIYATSTATVVNSWVDYDVDQIVDATELITWSVVNSAGTKANVTRTVSGSTRIVARDVFWSATYTYFTYNATRNLLTITLPADNASGLAPVRTVRTQVRLRNAV